MTSADFSQFVVTARLLFFLKPRLRDLPSYGRTLSGLYPLGLLSAVRIVIGLVLLLQHCPCLSALYQVLVHRANLLPPASFRFRLTADTLAFGCNLPTIRAVWGLTPVRVRSCWANQKGTGPERVGPDSLFRNYSYFILILLGATMTSSAEEEKA